MTDDEVIAYLRSLKPGEEVIETGKSCMTGKRGVVYISKLTECTCVRWECGMGTAATWGTRRIKDIGEIP